MLMPDEDTGTELVDDQTGEAEDNETTTPEPHWSDDYEDLGEDTKKLLAKYKTPKDAFEAHSNVDKMIGESIRLPKKDATDEEKAAQMSRVYNKLGRPETPEGYKLELPEGLPDALKPSEESTKEFFAWAHKQGLTQGQAQAIANLQAEKLINGLEEATAAQETATANAKAEKAAKQEKALGALKAEWGDDYEHKMQCAEKAYDVYGKDLEERARFFYQVYLEKLAEDTLIGGRAAASEGKSFFDYAGS